MVAYVAPVPGKSGQDETLTNLRRDLRDSKGRTHFVESMNTGWAADDSRTRPSDDWQRKRWGPEPPAGLVSLNDQATRKVLMACGVSPALFGGSSATASREAYRQALHGTIAPLGPKVQAELTSKLDGDVTLSFDALFAADIMGRARAFQSLVGAGMAAEFAARIVGMDAEGVAFEKPEPKPGQARSEPGNDDE